MGAGGPKFESWYPDIEMIKVDNKKKTVRAKSGLMQTMKVYVLSQLKRAVLYANIIFAMMLLCFAIFAPWENHNIKTYVDVVAVAVTLTVTSPVIWALAYKQEIEEQDVKELVSNKMSSRVMRMLYGVRFVAAWFFAAYIIRHFMNDEFWRIINLRVDDLPMAIAIGFVFMLILRTLSPAMKWYERMEARFLDNLNKRQTLQSFVVPEVLQENFVLGKMTLSAKSSYAGKSIRQCDFRNRFNVSVVCIDRAGTVIDLPRRDHMLFPDDEVTFLGAEEQLAQLRPQVEVEDEVLIHERPKSDMDIRRFVVNDGSCFEGVSLHDSDLRNRFDAFVFAIERDEKFMLNPESSVVFQKGDVVWFVSSENNAKVLVKEAESHVETVS